MASLLSHNSLLSRSPSSASPHSFLLPNTSQLSNLRSTKNSSSPWQLRTAPPLQRWSTKRCSAAVMDSLLPPSEEEKKADSVASLKLKLLSAVSGLNKGLAASEEDLKRAEYAAKELEAASGLVDLSTDLDKLQGRWKLIYSSAFSSRTLGGSRPGPPTGRLLPITLGKVFQRIDILSKDFDNIVELELGTPWPIPPIEVTATLAHKFEIIGSAKVKIVFEKTSVKATGSLSQLPPIEVPRLPDQLRPPSNTGSGEFEVTYVDADTRITRGDRGELRVFVIS